MKPAYDDDDLDDLDELSDDFECKHKPATKSAAAAAKSAAPVVKKPLAATTTCRHGDKADDAVVWRRQADDAGRREAKAGAHVLPRSSLAKTTCCRLSDSDDKPKVSSIKPLVDAKPKPATKPPVSLDVARGRFFRDARAGDDAEEEAADQQTKAKGARQR